ncbi:hypothetical protein DMC47_07770 [Nostoc sp. 3335mG]|nr:hypothetical protein DMC47_07770 [Nostoc sp. 3335mG]
MRTIEISCAGVSSLDDFWQRYLDAVTPDGASIFGRNLDAFWDAVEGGGPGWPGKTRLIFTHSSEVARLPHTDGTSFLEGLRYLANHVTNTRIELE